MTTAAQRRWRAAHRDRTRAYCRRWRKANPAKRRQYAKKWRRVNTERTKEIARAARLRVYGLTIAQYEQMLSSQGSVCKICGRPPRTMRLAVDHDHKTGRVRGLLCKTCNHRLLGRGLENPAVHRAAADYLESTFDGRKL